MKQLRWPTNKESHEYMRERQQQNLKLCLSSRAEEWMLQKLKTTGLKWTRQAQWGYRLFDFWCAKLGCAIEVDGSEHDADYDEYRDEYNFRRSGIIVIRVQNFDESSAEMALRLISQLGPHSDRKQELGISGNTKAAQLSLVNLASNRSFRREYLAQL